MTETIKEQPTQETLWAGQNGDRWLANVDRFEGMIKPIGDALIERAGCRSGEQIIDIGCGAGATSIAIAQQVGAAGAVTGLDISPVLVAEATKRAATLGIENVQFVLGDAAVTPLATEQADCIVSRFGIMFFSNPHAAFTHIHDFLKPSGRLSMVCWNSLPQNPWMFEVVKVIAARVPLPTPVPRAPGPFAFAEPSYVEEILHTAGFQDIDISPWQHDLAVGGAGANPESAAKFLLAALGVAQLPPDLPDAVRTAIDSELSDRLKTYHTEDGVQMPASAWLVNATA